jgi:hypothetical protein
MRSKPNPFPKNEQLIEGINSFFPEATASVIQDTVHVDERHKVVPFVSKQNNYGVSYWVWKKHKWKVVSIDTKGEPRIWKIDSKDPSTFHLVWNINPDNQINHMSFYLIRDRNYHVTEGVESYIPRVQMKEKAILKRSYGVSPLPVEWVTLLNAMNELDSANNPGLFFGDYIVTNMYFGWIPFDSNHKERFPEASVNSNNYGDGSEEIDYVPILDKKELEFQ